MRARLVGGLCLVVAAVGVGAAAPTSVLADTISIPVTITYHGDYSYQETATVAGALLSHVHQTVEWWWAASGNVPVSFNGSTGNGVANLPSKLAFLGSSSDSGQFGPSENCTYSAGSPKSAPKGRVTLTYSHGTFQAGYGMGIPAAASACNQGGTSSGSSTPTDVLECDLNLCEAGICPAAPPAVSSARFHKDVMTAFAPKTDYTKSGYVPLASDHNRNLGSSIKQYDLPAKTGDLRTSCPKLTSVVQESEKIEITSFVSVTLDPDKDLNVDFPTSLPSTHLTDLIGLDPYLPSNPSVSIPPNSPQYPGLDDLSPNLAAKTTTPSGSNPTVGTITIRCPRQDQRCAGTLSVTAVSGAPGGVLGRRSYSVPGGDDEILNVPLAGSAATALNRNGHLSVRVTVNSDVSPGSHHASGHRNVLLTQAPK